MQHASTAAPTAAQPFSQIQLSSSIQFFLQCLLAHPILRRHNRCKSSTSLPCLKVRLEVPGLHPLVSPMRTRPRAVMSVRDASRFCMSRCGRVGTPATLLPRLLITFPLGHMERASVVLFSIPLLDQVKSCILHLRKLCGSLFHLPKRTTLLYGLPSARGSSSRLLSILPPRISYVSY